VKTLEQIKAELRKANPKWSDTKLNNEAQAAFVKQRSDTNKPTLDWKTPDSQQESGVLFGFGIKERVLPIDVESFIVNLVKNNKSAYAKVQSAVKQVTGRTINDPSSLGSWVGRLATNMIKDEEVAKNVTIESFLRAAVGAGGQVGFTEEKALAAAAQAIAKAKPTDVQRQADISFMDWVFQNAPKDVVGGR